MIRPALCLLVLFFATLSTNANAQPVKVPAAFDKIYAPNGYDSNDHVQVVGEGVFPNSCYRPAESAVRIDRERRRIYVSLSAYEYPGICLDVLLPFDRVIDIGLLAPGPWRIQHERGGGKLGEIFIKPAATADADDFTYAPVSQAFFRQRGRTGEVYLTGDFLNTCMSLNDVKVTVENEAIVLQPILRVEERRDCINGKFPFTKVVQIDRLARGRYLLHVRSMNAKAINTLVDIR